MSKPASHHPELFQGEDELRSTLRVGKAEADRLRAELGRANPTADQKTKRSFQRWAYDRVVEMELLHPGGASTRLKYIPRNLSRGGISLFHSSYIHPGSRCTVTLPHRVHGTIALPGEIIRCRHVDGRIHEIGVRFDTPCNVRDVVAPELTDGASMLENVDPQKLTGSLLLVESTELDRMLVRQFLSESSLSVTAEATGKGALERCSHNVFDVVLSALTLEDMPGFDVLNGLRVRGFRMPVILIGAAPDAKTRELIRLARPDGFLVKPLTSERLLGALGDHLLLHDDEPAGAPPIYADLPPGHPALVHMPAFLEEVRKLSIALSAATKADDLATCRRVAIELSGSTRTFGFDSIGKLADSAVAAVDETHSVQKAAPQLRSLADACRRVTVNKAA